jgi:hypothetical protein
MASTTANSSSSSSGSSNDSSSMPPEPERGERSLVPEPLSQLPINCRGLCTMRSPQEEAALEQRLHSALPLLPVQRADGRRIR